MPETYRNYINGQWVECQAKKTLPNINPADTDEIIGHFQASGPDDVQAACDAAAKAQPAWAALPAPRRGEYLFKAAEILESRLAKLGEDMTREEGKTLPGSQRRSEARHQHLPLLRRRGRAPVQLPDSLRARQRFLLHDAQAAGRGGTDHAVEFPERDSGLEDGAGAGGRKHGGDQAGIARATIGVSPRGSAARGGHSCRSCQLRDGRRRYGGQYTGGPSRHPRRLFHRVVRSRRHALRSRDEAPHPRATRDGREESDDRPERLRPQLCCRRSRQRRVLLHRPEMHRVQPRHHRAGDLRAAGEDSGREDAQDESRQRARARHRHGTRGR